MDEKIEMEAENGLIEGAGPSEASDGDEVVRSSTISSLFGGAVITAVKVGEAEGAEDAIGDALGMDVGKPLDIDGRIEGAGPIPDGDNVGSSSFGL